MYEVIATGSKGNCVVYHKIIMVDCGVPFSALKDKINDLNIILLTHRHGDHFNLSTIKSIQSKRPSVRIACGSFMNDLLPGVKNVDVVDFGNLYKYNGFHIIPVKLYHDVENFGYRIFVKDYRIFHATDTAHLQGISAIGYDLYAIEHNYDEDTVYQIIERQELEGKFAHQKGSINSHLSIQQAKEFIEKNRKPESKVLRLHESSTIY